MAEQTPYFLKIESDRALKLDVEDALRGNTLLSLEAQADLESSDELSYIESHFAAFLRSLRHLDADDQELLLAYYVLAKTQTQLAPLFGLTQTLVSSKARQAMAAMSAHIMLGDVNAATLSPIFRRTGFENKLTVPLSKIVELYARTRSFQRVAEVFRLHRLTVRRTLVEAARTLCDESRRADERAVGAYLANLVDKSSASRTGKSARERRKGGDMYVCTPGILGQFRVDVSDPDFDHVFASRANR